MLLATLASGCASAAKISYDQYVWPPPPDPARIQLEDVVLGRADTLAKSRFQRALLGSSPQGPFDWLKRPFAVAFDAQGRLLVTDSALGALFRFDRLARKADVLGTTGAVALRTPLGLDVARDGRIYVADVGIRKVVAFDPDGKVRAVYGREGELENPTDAAVSPDGRSLLRRGLPGAPGRGLRRRERPPEADHRDGGARARASSTSRARSRSTPPGTCSSWTRSTRGCRC